MKTHGSTEVKSKALAAAHLTEPRHKCRTTSARRPNPPHKARMPNASALPLPDGSHLAFSGMPLRLGGSHIQNTADQKTIKEALWQTPALQTRPPAGTFMPQMTERRSPAPQPPAPNGPSSATRPAGRHDCDRAGSPRFALAVLVSRCGWIGKSVCHSLISSHASAANTNSCPGRRESDACSRHHWAADAECAERISTALLASTR